MSRFIGKYRALVIMALLLAAVFMAPNAKAEGVAVVKVEMTIGPVASKVITEAIDRAYEENRDLLIIELDTPGGLAESMRIICRKLLNSEIPVAVYVAPSGARAASAGFFITYSANIAAAAPGTNLGAAHVVFGQGQQPDSVMSEKVQNDAVAYITSIAKKRHRNIGFGVRAVRESASIDAEAALDSNVIDIIATDVNDLIEQINGREVELASGTGKIEIADKDDVTEYAISFKDKVLNFLTSPTLAFILFNLGWLGLVVEMYNPGAILPGVVGGICLILAFYSFHQLPINYAGLALIIFAVILFILEVKVVSHGILAVGGVISMLLGSFMLIDSPAPYLQISYTVIISTVLVITAGFFLIIGFAVRAHRKKVSTGSEGMVGEIGEVRGEGSVFVAGELWKAECDQPLSRGDKVRVLGVEHMRLKVEKIGG